MYVVNWEGWYGVLGVGYAQEEEDSENGTRHALWGGCQSYYVRQAS